MTDKKELKSIARFYKDATEGFATNDGYYAVPVMNSKTKLMIIHEGEQLKVCLLYTSPSPRDRTRSRMPSSA